LWGPLQRECTACMTRAKNPGMCTCWCEVGLGCFSVWPSILSDWGITNACTRLGTMSGCDVSQSGWFRQGLWAVRRKPSGLVYASLVFRSGGFTTACTQMGLCRTMMFHGLASHWNLRLFTPRTSGATSWVSSVSRCAPFSLLPFALTDLCLQLIMV
jgi:hypothetical protein